MKNKTTKISFLLIGLSFALSACSVSFPWEKDRNQSAPIDINEKVDVGNENSAIEPLDKNDSSLEGELRKFSDLKSLNNFLAKSKAVSSDLKHMWAEDSYGVLSDLSLKDLAESSVSLNRPDIVKIKGDYAYILSHNKLSVVKIVKDFETSPVFELQIEGVPLELDIVDNYLAISGYTNSLEANSAKDKGHYSFLKIFDISSASLPKELRSLLFEGHYAGLSLDNGFAHFLTISKLEYNLQAKVELPQVFSGSNLLDAKCSLSNECLKSQAYYFNNLYNSYGFLSSSAVSLSDNKKPVSRQLFLLDDSYLAYLSLDNNIYLSKHRSLLQSDLEREMKKELVISIIEEDDRLAMEKIDSVPSYLHTSSQKEEVGKIVTKYFNSLSDEDKATYEANLEDNLKSRVKSLSSKLDITNIYKFSWLGGKLSYLAKGTVSGTPLMINSFDEDSDSLRVITTRGDLWPLLFTSAKKNYSNLYVMDKDLNITSSLENIATENLISNASFMADRVYLKTAKEDNPVYVIGLKQDEPLSVLGAVSTEAYTNFYPFSPSGDNLLALGKLTSKEVGAEENLKLTVFDFKDLKKPAALSTQSIGDRESASFALFDHRSLSNSLSQKNIILPVSFMDKEQAKLSFSGALVFSYNNLGELNLLHRIDHSGGGLFKEDINRRGLNYLNSTVLRSFVSGNNIYTISSKYLKINNLIDGSEIASVNLLPDSQDELLPENEITIEGVEPEIVSPNSIPMAEAGIIIENQANKFFAKEGELLTISSINEEYGMYQADINTKGSPIKVFLNKDGSLFFSGIIAISDLENYEPKNSRGVELKLPESKEIATLYLNHLNKDNDKKYSIKELSEDNSLYRIIAETEDGVALAYYMSKDAYLFFSQVAPIN